MCFLLFVGTKRPIPRKEFDQNKPELCVESLTERDSPVRAYFGMPEVQYVGSTSNCGCAFPHLMFQNGGWPGPWDEKDTEQAESDRRNQELLADLLRAMTENEVELYGVWDGNFSEPKNREEIPLDELLKPDFYFKEQGFYKVRIR